jgi:cyclophilin family peptidyl-prolyl cis-trans isomerase
LRKSPFDEFFSSEMASQMLTPSDHDVDLLESPIIAGSLVIVTGLVAKPEHNGKQGRAVSWDTSKSRLGVHLDSGERLSLRTNNVRVVEQPAESLAIKAAQKEKERNLFKQMFSRPGTLSAADVPVVWRGWQLPRVFFDLHVDGEARGRVVIELWPDRTPKSAENFRALCTGERGISKSSRKRLCYRGSRFTMVADGLALFGGDTTRGDGSGGESIYGADYEDLSCAADGSARFDRPGVVAMGWPGESPQADPEDPNARKHPSYNSRFFIILAPEPHFDGKHPAVGMVVEGLQAKPRPSS